MFSNKKVSRLAQSYVFLGDTEIPFSEKSSLPCSANFARLTFFSEEHRNKYPQNRWKPA